jgi:hypothetical protein
MLRQIALFAVLLGLLTFAATASAAPSAVATFESLGLYWSPAGGASSKEAGVRYRPLGASSWKTAMSLWFDSRDSQYRGSIVGLTPGTAYEVELTLAGGASESLTASTWSESFPIAKTVTLPSNSSQTLSITESGSASGYVLYTAEPGGTATIDVAGKSDNCITIKDASHVIIRGLTLRGAGVHAIRLLGNVHDVVIEQNDISGWGRIAPDGWGVNYDSGVYAHKSTATVERIIIQRNEFHHPRSDSNDWGEYRSNTGDGYHPQGPQAITFFNSKGNHVFRYNAIYSDDDHRFNDGMGAGSNFSTEGFPNNDSDIYGNLISHCWDDGIESEGANRNVRIWGNHVEDSYQAIAVASTSIGPAYVYRNIVGMLRKDDRASSDVVGRGGFLKTKDVMAGGRIYVFHNTMLQPPGPPGSQYPLGGSCGLGCGGPMVNTTSRNNILQVYKSWWTVISDNNHDPAGDYDYDLYNGGIDAKPGSEANGIKGAPIYDPANLKGQYALDPSSPGFDSGVVLPNFNDGFAGAAPDIGASEAGSPPMQFGPDANLAPTPVPVLGVPLAINVGGADVASFVSDTAFNGGAVATNFTGAIDTTGLSAAAPQSVYHSERYGSFSYTLSGLSPDTSYLVRLHFCENYWSAAGKRLFDVAINGATVLDDFDIFAAAGGAHRAIVREQLVAADGGGLISIAFDQVADAALVNGIELLEPSAAGGAEGGGGDPAGAGGWGGSGAPGGAGTSGLDDDAARGSTSESDAAGCAVRRHSGVSWAPYAGALLLLLRVLRRRRASIKSARPAP